MKKILATVLALTMIVCMSITAFAAATEVEFDGNTATQTFTPSAGFNANADGMGGTVYYVTIEYTAPTFAYTQSSTNYEWDAENLQYKTVEGGVTGGWTGEAGAIVVKNYSNAAVTVAAKFTANDNSLFTLKDVASEDAAITALNTDVTVSCGSAAEGVSVGGTGTATVANYAIGRNAEVASISAVANASITVTITK